MAFSGSRRRLHRSCLLELFRQMRYVCSLIHINKILRRRMQDIMASFNRGQMQPDGGAMSQW